MTTTMPARALTLDRAARTLRAWRKSRRMELYGVESEETKIIAPELLRAIEAGVITSRTDAPSGEIGLEPGSFCAWLLRQGAPPQARPVPATALESTARDIHPATAAAWIAFGDAWTPERVAAFLHRTHLVQLILCDHERGAVRLDEETLALARDLERSDAVFAAAREQLSAALRALSVEAYAADAGRILNGADFANPIWLDVVAGKYVASPAAMMFTDDWERAAAAARRIGAVRLSGSDLKKKFGRRRSNALLRARAADALRGQFAAWRRGDRPLPKRVDWEAGLGRELAGSRYAASVVWKKVTKDPVYAAARAPGRRPENDHK